KRKISSPITEILEARFKMQGSGIVHGTSNSLLLQTRHNTVTKLRADHKLVVNVTAIRILVWQHYVRGFLEPLSVNARISPPAFRPAIEMLQLDAQHSCLDCIETKITAQNLVMVFRLETMIAKELQPFGKFGIIRRDHASVAEAGQVFR